MNVYCTCNIWSSICNYSLCFKFKWYYDKKKFTSLFPSDFKSMFGWHLTGKILSFEFCLKAVFFECKLRISWSTIKFFYTVWRDSDWPIGPQRVGLRIRWHQRLTSLKLQRVNTAYCTCKTRVEKYDWKFKPPCCILI